MDSCENEMDKRKLKPVEWICRFNCVCVCRATWTLGSSFARKKEGERKTQNVWWNIVDVIFESIWIFITFHLILTLFVAWQFINKFHLLHAVLSLRIVRSLRLVFFIVSCYALIIFCFHFLSAFFAYFFHHVVRFSQSLVYVSPLFLSHLNFFSFPSIDFNRLVTIFVDQFTIRFGIYFFSILLVTEIVIGGHRN